MICEFMLVLRQVLRPYVRAKLFENNERGILRPYVYDAPDFAPKCLLYMYG